jgi:hypothetical protein
MLCINSFISHFTYFSKLLCTSPGLTNAHAVLHEKTPVADEAIARRIVGLDGPFKRFIGYLC